MISITLNCASVEQLHQELRGILNGEPSTRPVYADKKCEDAPVKVEFSNVDNVPTIEAVPELPQAEKKTRTRKPKEIKPQEVNEAIAEEPFETKQHDIKADEPANAQLLPPKDDAIPTKEKVHQALQQVNVAVNLTKAREILAKYKVQRISEVQPSQYQAFIDDCNTAVAMS